MSFMCQGKPMDLKGGGKIVDPIQWKPLISAVGQKVIDGCEENNAFNEEIEQFKAESKNEADNGNQNCG